MEITEKHFHKLQKEAARYRWLRDIGDETWTPIKKNWNGTTDALDREIDKCMAASKVAMAKKV
jgi:hypothetical protein